MLQADRRNSRFSRLYPPEASLGVHGESVATRLRLKLAWHEEATQMAAMVEHSNDAVFSRRLDGTIATWNSAAERIFGFKAAEIIGRTSSAILPKGHLDEFRRLLLKIRRGEVVQHFETERLRKDGKRIFVSLTLSPVRDQRGRL